MKTENQINDLKNENDKLWLALLHLSGIVPVIFLTIIFYNWKKTNIKEMAEHYRAILAFQSFIFLIWILGLWGSYRSGMHEPIYGILIVGVMFSVINTLRVLNGQTYKYLIFSRFKKQ